VVSNSADPDDTSFVYDADGVRVKRVHGDEATCYVGAIEIETDGGDVAETHSIYSLGGGVNAVRVVTSPGDDGEVTFTFGDHLGSSSTIWQAGELGDTDPGVTSYQRYYPYGEPRDDCNPSLPTDHTFTGQITDGLLDDGGTGLMYYGARYYDPQVGRFAAADTIVPNPGDPQDLNRYAYVSNNPVNGIDPTGHVVLEGDELGLIGGFRRVNRKYSRETLSQRNEVEGLDPEDRAGVRQVLVDPRLTEELPEGAIELEIDGETYWVTADPETGDLTGAFRACGEVYIAIKVARVLNALPDELAGLATLVEGWSELTVGGKVTVSTGLLAGTYNVGAGTVRIINADDVMDYVQGSAQVAYGGASILLVLAPCTASGVGVVVTGVVYLTVEAGPVIVDWASNTVQSLEAFITHRDPRSPNSYCNPFNPWCWLSGSVF
jgi:RHS repeat-associated protein